MSTQPFYFLGLLLFGEELPDFGQGNTAHAIKDKDSAQEEVGSKTVSFFLLYCFAWCFCEICK